MVSMSRHWPICRDIGSQCHDIGQMSRHWSNVTTLVKCHDIGQMSRHWSNVTTCPRQCRDMVKVASAAADVATLRFQCRGSVFQCRDIVSFSCRCRDIKVSMSSHWTNVATLSSYVATLVPQLSMSRHWLLSCRCHDIMVSMLRHWSSTTMSQH